MIEDVAGNDLASISNLAVTNRTKRSELPLNVNVPESMATPSPLRLTGNLPQQHQHRHLPRHRQWQGDQGHSDQTQAANREALLTLQSAVAFGDSVALSYTDAQGNQKSNVIEDVDGNDLATIAGLSVTNNTKSTSDLKVDYAEADGSTINLYFTDSLSSAIPKASRFRVTANKRKQNRLDLNRSR